MPTALSLIERSLRLCGILGAGETLPAEEAEDALTVLNDMLDAWRLESLLVYNLDRQVFPLTPGVQMYTIGVGGVWNVPRPVRIDHAFFQDISSEPRLELPIYIMTDDEYQSLRVKTVSSTWPQALYYNPQYPIGQVIVYPVPTLPNNVVLYLWSVLGQIASVSTVVDFPPGYRRAVQYCLARELAAEYGKTLSPDVVALALESKGRVKDLNADTPVQVMDSAMTGANATFNIYADDYNWRN